MHAAFLSPLLHINYSSLISKITSCFHISTATQAVYNNIWMVSMITAVLGGMVYGMKVWRVLAGRGEFWREEEDKGTNERGSTDEKVDWEGDTDVEK
jgi:cytochrome b subunit of formate dehydrogenase